MQSFEEHGFQSSDNYSSSNDQSRLGSARTPKIHMRVNVNKNCLGPLCFELTLIQKHMPIRIKYVNPAEPSIMQINGEVDRRPKGRLTTCWTGKHVLMHKLHG